MQESNSLALRADARDAVNQLGPRGAAALEGCVQIIHGEANVMDGGASPGDEPPNRRIRLLRLEQLDNRASGVQSGYPRAVGVGQIDLGHPQYFPVERENFGDGVYRNPDMGDSRAMWG